MTLRKRCTGSNLVDVGRVQRATAFNAGGRLPRRLIAPVVEVTVKVCGVAVTMLSGYQLSAGLVDRIWEYGNRWPSCRVPAQPGRGRDRFVAD